MSRSIIVDCIQAVHAAVLDNEAAMASLDRAVGDGDHYLNIRRGCQALVALAPQLEALAPGEALQAVGTRLLATVGGASGPLLASFFADMGAALASKATPDRREVAHAVAAGVDAVRRRGKAELGEKTMLDVLIPVSRLLARLALAGLTLPQLCRQLDAEATRNMLATRDMMATKGRASALGERALGHIDPGCKTCEVAIAAITQAVLRHAGA